MVALREPLQAWDMQRTRRHTTLMAQVRSTMTRHDDATRPKVTTAHHAVDGGHIARWENEGGASAPAEMPPSAARVTAPPRGM
jgi:hypothetical protein